MARPEGFEPPAFGIGIHCDIQLRHGRRYFDIVHHFRSFCKRYFCFVISLSVDRLTHHYRVAFLLPVWYLKNKGAGKPYAKELEVLYR